MNTNFQVGLLLSLLATACGPANPADQPASEPPTAIDTKADGGSVGDAALDSAPGETAASDTGEAAPAADAGPVDPADATSAESGPPTDAAPTDTGAAPTDTGAAPTDTGAAPPAWDACDVATTGAPFRIAQPLFPTHRARDLTIAGERLLYISSGVTSTELSMAKTTAGYSTYTLLVESDLSLLATNGRDVIYSTSYSTIASTDLVGSWPKYFGGWARSIAVDERDVFYTLRAVRKDGMDGAVFRVPIGGSGMGKQIAVGAVSSGLARDASGLYLGSAYTPPLETPELYIGRLDPNGESAEGLAMRSGFNDSYLALTPSHIVVLALGATHEIFTVRKSDGAMKTLATLSYPFKTEIHTDGTYAYWIASKEIRRVALDGSKAVETIFAGACDPQSLAVDGEHVYFLTSPWTKGKETTTVWKLKKP